MKARHLLATALALVVSGSSLGLLAPAFAEPVGVPPSDQSPLSAQPTQMWQTDQTAWATAYSNGVLYVGGAFNNVRPPGVAIGGAGQVAQGKLAAFDATTGDFIASWTPLIGGGSVFSLNVSPDGSRLYVGGNFTKVNTKAHQRIAAFDISNPRSPVLLTATQFAAKTNAKVSDIASTNDSVYLGGDFTTAGGVARTYNAAFTASGGALLPWNVSLTGVSAPSYTHPFVTSVEIDPNSGNVEVGGLFDNVNGHPQHGLAVVDPVNGTAVPGFTIPAIINTSYITATAYDGGKMFIAGRDDKSGSTNREEGVMALDASTGAILWGSNQHRCLGDSFALTVLHGAVWVGTHAHDCSRIGGYPETNPRFYGAVLGQDVNTGEQEHFYPETIGKPSIAGSQNNIRAFATDGERLFAVGGFSAVNSTNQQNIVVFEPKTDGGAAPLKVAKPTVSANSTGGATVSWIASSDRDDYALTYNVYRNKQTTPFTSITADSVFWQTKTLSIVDPAATPGSSVNYRVQVTDGTSPIMSLVSATIVMPPLPTNYNDAVLADGPAMYWKLDDSTGSSTLADASGHGDTGTVVGAVGFGQTGALSSGPNQAGSFNGNTYVYSNVARANPTTYTMELWFKTTSNQGGKLMGLGNSRTGNSSQYDRHIYMTNDGTVIFGAYTGSTVTLQSANGLNNGAWHQVVATQGSAGMTLYIDGAQVGSNTNAVAENYTGYIRVGGDNLSGWPGSVSNTRYNGTIDEVSYYTNVLTPAQVAQHYNLR